MRMIARILATTACLFAACSSFAVAAVATFSELPRGDKLVIRFQSTGCFHASVCILTFDRESGGAIEVDEMPLAWSESKRELVDGPKSHLGRFALKEGDAGRLDALLQFYRTLDPKGWCTTVDVVHFAQMRDGKAIAEESFRDGSCSTYNRPDLLPLWKIAAALRKQAEK